MRRALAETALRAAAAATAAGAAAGPSSLRGGGALAINSSSSIDHAASVFARASSSAAASSSASAVSAAAEGDVKRSSGRGGNKTGERPARQPRRQRNDGASSTTGGIGGGGGRTGIRSRDDGFSGSSTSFAPASYDKYGDAVPPAVINHAGEGAPGWQLLGEEPEISANFWALDAAGGRAGGAPEFAALLSSDAKDAMWAAYKGKGLSTSAIAKLFGVREQRAAAILALRAAEEEMEAKNSAGSNNSNEEVQLLFEGGVDAGGAVRAALDAAAARVALVERKRLEGIGQAPPPPEAAAEEGEGEKEGEGEEKGKEEEKSAEEARADAADTAVAAELSADAAAGAALRDIPSSSSLSRRRSLPAAGAVVEVVQGIWPCDRLGGGGERAVAPLPRYPAFELLLNDDDGDDKKKKNKKSSSRRKNSSKESAHADEETPAESDVPAAERARALEAEAAAVREFKARLAFNSGSTSAARAVLGVKSSDEESFNSSAPPPIVVAARRSVSRAAVAPRRPEGGWPLLVKPLSSAKGKAARERPFVASPDGTRRPLSAEERAALKRATPLARRRGVVS